MDGAAELGIGGAGEEGFDGDIGEGLDVVFVVGVEVEDGVADLLDVDGAVEADCLSCVSLCLGRTA